MSYTIDDAVAAIQSRNQAAAEQAPEATELNNAEQVHVDPDAELDPAEEVDESLPIDGEVDADDGEDGVEQDALPTIEPPEFWDSASKERFSNLPREAQELVAEQAKYGSAAVARALHEANTTRKTFEEKASKINETLSSLEQVLPIAQQKFAQSYPPDYEEQLDRYLDQNPEAAAQINHALVEYRREKQELERMTNTARSAYVQAQSAFVQQEEAKLIERAVNDPTARKLTDPQTGQTARKAVFDYLTSQDVPAEAVHRASSAELILAYKAMMFDKAQSAPASQGERSTPRTSGMKPSTTLTSQPKAARLADLQSKAARSGDVNDVLALIEAKRAANQRK